MTGKISDLTAADRLRSADVFELQDQTIVGSPQMDAMTLGAGIPFDTTTQLLGATAANTMEVEANTRAARLTLRPDEINYPTGGFQVGRHVYCASNFGYITIGAGTVNPGHVIFEFAWVNVAGIAIIKKVLCDVAVGASSNSTAGSANISMYRTFGLGPALDTSNVQIPGAQSGNSVGGRSPVTGCSGMKSAQPPPQARVNGGINRDVVLSGRGGGAAAENAWLDPSPIGAVEAGYKGAAGITLFRNAMLYDWMVASQPFILVPGTGFEVQMTTPSTSAASSTTIMPFVTVYWDEWTLSNPRGDLT